MPTVDTDHGSDIAAGALEDADIVPELVVLDRCIGGTIPGWSEEVACLGVCSRWGELVPV
jgi:hypothetical protein